MHRIILFLLAILFPVIAHTLYLGNPASPEIIENGLFLSQEMAFGLKAGYQGDFVFDRNLFAHGKAHGRIDSFSIRTNQGVMVFNFFDRYEIYGSIGAMDICFAHRPHTDNKRREYDFHNQFTWGGGARALLFEWDQVCFGVDAKYQQAHPDIRWITLNGASIPPHGSIQYREWQVGAAFSYHADLFIPYLGAVYSHVHAEMQHLPSELGIHYFTMGSRQHFGMVIGCTLSKGEIIDLCVELRFFDESALTLAGNIKF